MRVAHIISGVSPTSGGPIAALIGLAKAQIVAGMELEVITCWVGQAPPPTLEELRKTGARVHSIGPCKGKLRHHPDIKRVLNLQLPPSDVVHIHGLWEDIQHQAASLARKLNKPYIISPHGMLDPWSLRQSRLRKKIYLALRLRRHLNHAAAFHFTAEAERELASSFTKNARSLVVPIGIDLNEFEPLPPRGFLRTRHPELAGGPMLMFLGRVFPGKGVDLLIQAMVQLRQHQAGLAVVGPARPEHEKMYRGLADQLGVSDRVVFTGPLYGHDRIKALADADLFVLPSAHENFGIVVIEALAAGVPVLISDQVGIYREIVGAGVGGVFSLGVETLTQEIVRWLDSPTLRTQAAALSREYVKTHYDWNQIAQQWVLHYQSLIARR